MKELELQIKKIEKFIDSYPGEQVYVGESDYGDDWVEQENRHNRELLRQAKNRVKYLKSKLKKLK